MRCLHYYPGNASMAPHMLLEEIGLPFQLLRVDREHDAHKSAAYLELNPNGLIPVLTEGALVLYESAAICLHLCDTAPTQQWIPAIGTAERAHCCKWLVWMTNTLQATLLVYFYPERWLNDGNVGAIADLKAHAESRVGQLLEQLDAELARHGGAWLMGEHYSVVDPYCFMLCRWTRGFTAALPARNRPHLGPYLRRMLARPAVQRALATEQIKEPFV